MDRRSSRAVLVSAAVAGVLLGPLVACGGKTAAEDFGLATDGGGPSLGAASLGDVSVQVVFPSGVPVSTLSYVLTGPGGFARSLTMTFSGGPVVRIEFGIGNVPPSDGEYTIGINTSGTGGATCAAESSFVVTAGQQAVVMLTPECNMGLATVSAGPPPVASSAPPVSSAAALDAAVAPPPDTTEARGEIVVNFVIPSSVSISTLHTALTGPNGLNFVDSLTLAANATMFSYQNVPAATGDAVALSATSTDGTQICEASTVFDVVPARITTTTLYLMCQPSGLTARDD
jgi:hypothetical protein